jgi:hypothetical protein
MLGATTMTQTYHRVNKAIARLMRSLQTHPEWLPIQRQYVAMAIRHLNAWRRNPYDWRLEYATICIRLARTGGMICD